MKCVQHCDTVKLVFSLHTSDIISEGDSDRTIFVQEM